MGIFILALMMGGVELVPDAGMSTSASASDAGMNTLTDAGTLDAGTLTPDIFSECPEVDFADGGHAPYAFPVEAPFGLLTQATPDGGNDWYMPYPRGQRISCKLGACEERVKDYDAWSKPLPAWVLITQALSSLAGGFLAAYEICSRFPALCKGL